MCKRNAELELEALKELAKEARQGSSTTITTGSSSSSTSVVEATVPATVPVQPSLTTNMLPSSSEPTSSSSDNTTNDDSSTTSSTSSTTDNTTDDKEYEEAIAASMLDVEYAKRQAELEIAQLEAAMAASLAIEEERLRLLKEQEAEEQAIALSLQPLSNSTKPSSTITTSTTKNNNENSTTSPKTKSTSNSNKKTVTSNPLTTSLQDLPSLPGMNQSSTVTTTNTSSSSSKSKSILDTVLNFTKPISSESLPSISITNNSLPSLTSSSPTKHKIVSSYSDELDAALLGTSNYEAPNTDDTIDISLLPLGVRRAENYIEESKARLESLKQRAAKRDDEISPEELASRQSHLREVRDALRAKTKNNREKILTETEQNNQNTTTDRSTVRKKVGEAMNAVRAIFDTNIDNSNEEDEELTEEDKRKLVRLALAQKIKADVIAATTTTTTNITTNKK